MPTTVSPLRACCPFTIRIARIIRPPRNPFHLSANIHHGPFPSTSRRPQSPLRKSPAPHLPTRPFQSSPAAQPPTARNHPTNTPTTPASMVEIGTAFESDTIASLRSFHMDLRRVGGANDKGVDLRGKWVLSGSAGSSAPHTVPIIVQCKASRTPLGPKYLRELEGTLARESAGTIAVMACYEGYTRAAVEVCLGSVRPMILAVVERVGRRCVGFTMNRATQYLLPGVRMVRGEAGVRVWYGGRCLGEGVGGGG